jgi:diguanylate cyclase (GGDEF)-like protein
LQLSFTMLKSIDKKKLRVLAFIGLPIILVIFVLSWNNFRMLNGISDSVNRQEKLRVTQAIDAAFASLRDQMAITIADNAKWDDAYENAGSTIKLAWLKNTWVLKEEDPYYDTSYILDAEGHDLFGNNHGKPARRSARNYYGATLAEMLAKLPENNTDFKAVSSVARTAQGHAIVSLAQITPTDAGTRADKPRNILVFSKLINGVSLARIGKTYIIDGLMLGGRLGNDRPHYAVKDVSGRPVAIASWKMADPGKAVRGEYAGHALIMVLSLLCFLCPIALVHYRTLAAMDSSERKAVKAARIDPLSGLANRVQLLERLDQLLAQSPAENVTLAFIDLDGFKAVNDTYDHETGDKLIRAFGAGLAELAVDCVLSARLGGDEFAFLVRGPDCGAKAELVAGQVIAFCREPFDLDGRMASIGASIGLAHRDGEVTEAAELMRRADIAMYDAKSSGRNQWRWFDASLEARRSSDLVIANEMRGYLDSGTFSVAYQPIVDADTLKVVGVEALARWPGPAPLLPDRFIPVAEEHGMIDQLCEVVLRTAITELAPWPELNLAVNVSALQLNNKQLVSNIVSVLHDLNFAPARLELEFTETHLIRSKRRTKEIISQLQSQGIRVALDDFGIGYASVGYLRDFAFDTIKLDRSLAHSLAEGRDVRKIVQGTVLIAKGLSANVVAEGIETDEQAGVMKMLGANKLQGYYFGRPVPAKLLLAKPAAAPCRDLLQCVG